MRLLVCGTGAAEGWPAVFCECSVCLKAQEEGGPNLRSRTAYALGETLRIDWGPDSYWHTLRFSLPSHRLQHLLITHSHQDHWQPEELFYRRPGFSVVPEDRILHIYGNQKVEEKMGFSLREDFLRCRIQFHRASPWERLSLSEGVSAIPILANHDPKEQCLNYILQWEQVTVLQGNDTGWYSEETWDFLSQFEFDLVLLDSTSGKNDTLGGHLGCPGVVRAKQEMEKRGCLKPSARFVAVHFSHNGGWLHSDLEKFFQPYGIEVAWDGMSFFL